MRRDEAADAAVCRVYLARLTDEGRKEQSRLLLRQTARAYLATLTAGTALTAAALADDSLFELGFSQRGKPYFPRLPQLHFSLTHSGGYWACGFAPTPLGLDMQWQQARVDVQRLGRRCFHSREAEWLQQRRWSRSAFFALWTAKEAYAKYSGAGLSWQLLAEPCLLQPPPGLQLCRLAAPDGYSLCLCAARELSVEVLQL